MTDTATTVTPRVAQEAAQDTVAPQAPPPPVQASTTTAQEATSTPLRGALPGAVITGVGPTSQQIQAPNTLPGALQDETNVPAAMTAASRPGPERGTAQALIAAVAVTQAQKAATQGAAQQTAAQAKTATLITKAISLGLDAMPNTPVGWAQLVDKYSGATAQREFTAQVAQAEAMESGKPTPMGPKSDVGKTPTKTAPPTPTSPGPPPAAQKAPSPTPAAAAVNASGIAGMSAFLWAIRQHESGQTYTVANYGPTGASGAYQFIFTTWQSEANEAGYGQYANKPAATAPPSVQDAVAEHMATQYWDEYHTWSDAAQSWYTPSRVGQDVIPFPTAGNNETETTYGSAIVQLMTQAPGAAVTTAAHTYATLSERTPQAVLGVVKTRIGQPSDLDNGGFVQWAYGQNGMTLPATAQQQYNATAKIAAKAALQPGDLLFFGRGPDDVTSVGIYAGTGRMITVPNKGNDVQTKTVFPSLQGKLSGVPGKMPADYVGATRPTTASGATTGATQAALGHSAFEDLTGGSSAPSFNTVALNQYVKSQMEALA